MEQRLVEEGHDVFIEDAGFRTETELKGAAARALPAVWAWGLRRRQAHGSGQSAAVPALIGAAAVDPLRAAIDALYAAAVTFESDYRIRLDDLRRAFPTITRRLE